MTPAEFVVYPLRCAVRALLSLPIIGQGDRLSLETIDAAAGRLAAVYTQCTGPGFGVSRLISQVDPLYARARPSP